MVLKFQKFCTLHARKQNSSLFHWGLKKLYRLCKLNKTRNYCTSHHLLLLTYLSECEPQLGNPISYETDSEGSLLKDPPAPLQLLFRLFGIAPDLSIIKPISIRFLNSTKVWSLFYIDQKVWIHLRKQYLSDAKIICRAIFSKVCYETI